MERGRAVVSARQLHVVSVVTFFLGEDDIVSIVTQYYNYCFYGSIMLFPW